MKPACVFPWLLALTLTVQAPPATGQETYTIEMDRHLSAPVGAENLLAAHRAFYALENRLLKPRLFDESNAVRKSAGVLYRLGKTVLVDNVTDHMAMLTQHEVFGHGARFREFGFERISYRLNVIPPYGRGDGSVSGRAAPDRRTTRHERISVITGGTEANALLSNSIRSRWLRRGHISTRETVLYLLSSLDLSGYILRTRFSSGESAGNDIRNYLRELNALEGHREQQDYRLTLESLSIQSAIGFLDPTVLWALYAFSVPYLLRGQDQAPLPILRFGRFEYLPSMRLGLTPFGSVVHLENLFVAAGRLLNVHVRYGIPAFHHFGGFGVSYDHIDVHRNIMLGSRIELWHQPPLLLGGRTARTKAKGLGGGLWADVRYRFSSIDLAPALYLRIGYKTDGFLEGEPLNRGFVMRFGVGFQAR